MKLAPPRLRTVLLVVNLAIMLLPLGSLTFLRLYENEMIRQKEAALYAQAAYLAAVFRQEIETATGGFTKASAIGHEIPVEKRHGAIAGLLQRPEVPSLSLQSSTVRPPHRSRPMAGYEPDAATLAAAEALLPVILRGQTANMDHVRVVSAGGAVVASTLGEEGRHLLHWEEVTRALQGSYTATIRRTIPYGRTRSPLDSLGLGAPIQVFVALPVVQDTRILGAVLLTGTPSQIMEFVYGNRGQLLTALAVLMLAVILISVLTSLTLSEPVQRVVRQTHLVAKGDPEGLRPIRFPMLREIGQLSQAIARMATTIDERAAYITGFARSVSHEFKTPLTSITGAAELLAEHADDMSPAERSRFLASLRQDAARLTALVDRLLEKARADVQTAAAHARADVVQVTRAVVDRHVAKGLSVTVDAGADATLVQVSDEIAESLVGNLLDNVRLHCPQGTNVTVEIRRDGKLVHLIVRDDGPGLSPANQAKAFEPFFTTARKSGGTGLGLSIVKALAKAHGGSASLESSPAGTTVTVSLLAADG